MSDLPKIIYTDTDEAPRLATYSLLPIIRSFTKTANIEVELRDISLAGRILSAFNDRLTPEQKISDDLAYLGELAKDSRANIIKLPNISASPPQLQEAIRELKNKGYNIPDYPEEPNSDDEREVKARYDAVKGSAVNPVLREGNSDRRAAKAVKDFAKKFPHKMGSWEKSSKSHVAHMESGDFYGSEISTIAKENSEISIVFEEDKNQTVLAEKIRVTKGEIIDSAFMSKKALCEFFENQIKTTPNDVLFSLHLKATMMKVSDPKMFGHCVRAYYREALEKHSDVLEQLGTDPNNGIGDVYEKINNGEIATSIYLVGIKLSVALLNGAVISS